QRVFRIAGIVGAEHIPCAAQVGGRTDQIDGRGPHSPDFGAAHAQAIFLTLIEQIATPAAIRLRKSNLNTAFLLRENRSRDTDYQRRDKDNNEFQNRKALATTWMLAVVNLHCPI